MGEVGCAFQKLEENISPHASKKPPLLSEEVHKDAKNNSVWIDEKEGKEMKGNDFLHWTTNEEGREMEGGLEE